MKKLFCTKITLIFIVLVSFFVGCATIHLDTSEKKYLGARSELNLLLEQYTQIQDRISDEDHEKAKEAFYKADAILDAWELMLGKDYDYSTDMAAWLETKNIILNILLEVL